MRTLFLFLIFVFCIDAVLAQSYNIQSVPDSLMQNANVVCRYSELYLSIINEKKAKLNEKVVYTILNDAGKEYADYKTTYDKFDEIDDIDGSLYNAAGKKLKEVKKKDISDNARYDGFSLMSDARYKEHNFYYSNYPYTVEYEETDNWNQMFYLPSWNPQISPLMSVENSRLIVETPLNYKFRYKEFNINASPVITQKNDKIIYTWQLNNITTKEEELFQPSWRELMPSILIAPSVFAVGNYEGNMDNWLNFGYFINELRKGRDVLPDNVKQQVHVLTDAAKDPHEKINILYNYLQQNSRYVSVQLGVGGWQPFDANYVATNKYGDCKALSNYMVALLNEAGIKADYVLIDADKENRPMYADFPINEFNHATVCVPLNKDSVWLECTSQTQAAGYAGTFTGNRKALLIDDNGGHIVSTPNYTSKENKVIRTINALLDKDGNLSANVNTQYTGCETDNLRLQLEYLNKQQFEEILKKKFDIPTYDANNYSSKETKTIVPSIDEHFELTATGYASVMGKRIFLQPNLLAHNSIKIDTSEERKYDIELKQSFTHIDSVIIKLASNYNIESLPKDVVLNEPFGVYSIHFTVSNNVVSCVRLFEQNVSRFPASDSKKFAAFINAIYKADRSRIVFIKKEG